MTSQAETVLALDVGSKRIGIAIADTVSRLPKPLQTLRVGDKVFDDLAGIVKSQGASKVVLGLPRNLQGEKTQQTDYVESFKATLTKKLNIPVYLTDEAVTSVQAEEELRAQGRPYTKGDIDALAAVYILEDFLNAYQEVS